MALTLGIIDLYAAGQLLDAEKGSTVRLPGNKNNPVPVGHKLHRAQEFQGGEITATVVLRAGDKLSSYLPGEEMELQASLDTGTTITTMDAFLLEVPTATGGDGGKMKLTWNFSTYQEV